MRRYPSLKAIMKTLVAAALGVCLMLLPWTGDAAGTDREDSRQAWLRARITLDATGKLTSLEWMGTRPNDRVVTKPLEAAVRGWEFEPGTVDGVPAITETGLMLRVALSRTDEGGLSLRIDDARTGALGLQPTAPVYPGDQLRRRVQAHVMLEVKTDPAGKVESATVIDYLGSVQGHYTRKDFEAAALQAAKSWTYLTEQVAGKGVASSLRVPIGFCIDDAWCDKRPFKDPTLPLPAGMAVAMDSVAKITTRTSQVEI